MELAERCRRIKLLLMDVDGVLTDGRLYFGAAGEDLKVFHVRDGYGLKLWHRAGFRSGIISGRDSDIVSLRASQLGMSYVYQGEDDKLSALTEVLAEAGTPALETAFVGDDSLDVPIFENVGLAIAVADAHPDAQRAAHYTTRTEGGCGAVREVIDLVLTAKSNL
jgi:3-deoxy-D-manno-octulosonate 8-phosphate phosphatase (KDO 8-P phosphatase)